MLLFTVTLYSHSALQGHSNSFEQHQKDKEEPSFSEVEELFLQTTFDKMDFLTAVRECAIEKHQSSIGFSVHQNLKESLVRYLLGLSEQLLSNYSFEKSPSKIACGFFLRLLTSKLLNDIADICKTLAFTIKKPFDHGDVESMEDDTNGNLMEVEDQSSMNLFDDYPDSSVSDANEPGESQSTIGAINPLAEEYLSKQDLLFLDMLKFLCLCVTTVQTNTVSFRAADIRRKLLMLIDSSTLDPTKSLHLHMYLMLLKELPGKEYPLPMEDVIELLKPLSLFQDTKRDASRLLKALPLKLQQTAFQNAYLKAQEGMREMSHSAENPEPLDEIYNRKSVLLMLIAVVLSCSPICEKQALFALCKSVKENGLEPHLVKKVLQKVSETFGYRCLEDFMASHLDYLVLEWLNLQDTEYSLSSFPFILLNYTNIEDFYRSRFDEVKCIANQIQEDWKSLLTDCFPKILVNILPYFACEGTGDSGMAQQRETATKVYDKLKSENLLGKQVGCTEEKEIVVELLMTLHEPADSSASQSTDLCDFSGDLDPAPNPPHFPSHVIKATFAYISNCHKTKLKSILEILSKSP
ncbi:hypothetical protein P7K49_020777 [Saguinus oedipus]|uniref:Uncharacterized protein n=1 Tax=Saguinus oedipus TaxID=9490 RepID=A0ABQ9URJ4_SAGOE|nr:hypothetical protein P7K49_020777 [Saguinus oedipus]